MSFLTCFWLLPQNEHFNRSPPSPMRATRRSFPSVLLNAPPAKTSPAHLLLPCRFFVPCRRYLLAHADAPIERRCRVLVTGVPRRADKPPSDEQVSSLVARGLAGDQHLVDEAVLLGLGSGQDLVPLDIFLDQLHGAAGVVGQGLLEPGTHAQHLVGLDLEVAGHAAEALSLIHI